MIVGAVDIGTNSMRLLVTDGDTEFCRETRVTGLGRGVDASGRFDVERGAATLSVLGGYGRMMDRFGVERRRAVATSATRDAADGAEFVEMAGALLGTRPEVISGIEEASLSFRGAIAAVNDSLPSVVIDIGGGSTEFVFGERSVVFATSIDLGSVRLTDRVIPSLPAPLWSVGAARAAAARAFSDVALPGTPDRVIGVAGAFTSLSAIALDLPAYDRDAVHGSVLTRAGLSGMIRTFAGLSLDQTAAIPSLDPKRAPVILAGAVVAEAALAAVGATEATISEYDLLDALAASLLDRP